MSLCSRLNFRRAVVTEVVDRVLHLAEDGPAVSLWVACTLLCLAAAEDERDGCGKEEVRRSWLATSPAGQLATSSWLFHASDRSVRILVLARPMKFLRG